MFVVENWFQSITSLLTDHLWLIQCNSSSHTYIQVIGIHRRLLCLRWYNDSPLSVLLIYHFKVLEQIVRCPWLKPISRRNSLVLKLPQWNCTFQSAAWYRKHSLLCSTMAYGHVNEACVEIQFHKHAGLLVMKACFWNFSIHVRTFDWSWPTTSMTRILVLVHFSQIVHIFRKKQSSSRYKWNYWLQLNSNSGCMSRVCV